MKFTKPIQYTLYFYLSILCSRKVQSIEQDIEFIADTNCEPIQGECNDQGYKYTVQSDAGNHRLANQKAADAFIKSFELMQPCSAYLKIFLCGTYKPSCHSEVNLIVQPCRSMCEHVYRQCYPLMQRFNLNWNAELNCSRFLEDSSEACMKDPGYGKDAKSNDYLKQVDLLLGLKSNTEIGGNNPRDNPFENYVCYSKLYGKFSSQCSLLCNAEIIYSQYDKKFTRNFLMVLSLVCALSTFLAIISRLFEKKSLHFTNKIFICISTCYFIYSLVTLVGLKLGPDLITCQNLDIKKIQFNSMNKGGQESEPILLDIKHYLVMLKNIYEKKFCAISMLVSYFFLTAALTMWLLIAVWWFLAIQFKIKTENYIYLMCLCLVTGILPVIKTVLMMQNEVGETFELTGLCIPGTTKSTLLKYSILPHACYLLIGLLSLLSGFYILIFTKDKTVNKTSNEMTKQAELVRIGITSLLCSLPFLVVLFCNLFEYFNTESLPKMPSRIKITSPKGSMSHLTEKDYFNMKFREQFGDKVLTDIETRRLLIIHLIKLFMTYLNGFLIFVTVLLSDNFEIFKSKKESTKPKMPKMSFSMSNSQIEAYATEELYERGQFGTKQAFRPVSDHIYYQPNCFSIYDGSVKLAADPVREMSELNDFFDPFSKAYRFEKVLKKNLA